MNQAIVIESTLDMYSEFIENMERRLNRFNNRLDYAELAEQVASTRNTLSALEDQLKAGMDVDKVSKALYSIGDLIQKTRLSIRKTTGVKRWAEFNI
jgi:archaellum component FlaC